MRITLKGRPYSTNNLYYHASSGSFMKPKQKELKNDYIKQVKEQVLNGSCFGGFNGIIDYDVEVKIDIYFNVKGRQDWDNFHKLSMDAMTGIIWEDDSQIKKATVELFYEKHNPRIEVDIRPYEIIETSKG